MSERRAIQKQPMPLFVASIEQAGADRGDEWAARRLTQRFWPGALTIVPERRRRSRHARFAGGDTIARARAWRPAIREMAAQLGPLTGTSANIAGREECHTAEQVRAQLGDAVDLIVDAPIDATGTPSTIVDCTRGGPGPCAARRRDQPRSDRLGRWPERSLI